MNFVSVDLNENIQFDRAKFEAAVHYICATVPVEELGRVKLHKVLYFADMLQFVATGRPLTGVEYQKQPFGPAARHLKAALDKLERDGLLEVSQRDYFGFPKCDFLSKADPDTRAFSEAELSLLHEVMDFVRLKSARAISDFSHNEAWSSVSMGDRIPYYSAYALYPVEVDDEDTAWGVQEAQRIVADRAAHGS